MSLRRATFFTVGELAEHYPDLVRRISDCGFEVASHSQTHPRLDGDDREAIREHLSGNYCRCTGYQAIISAVCDVIEGRAGA